MILLLSLFACGPAETTEDPTEHACEHRTEAGTAVTAGADVATAASIPISEEPYTVTLTDGAPGFVAVDVPGDTAALLFLGTADVAAELYQDGTAVGLPEPGPVDLCATDIPEHFDLDFHEAGTWTIELGPSAVSEVWLMLMSAEGHSHEE